MSNERNIFFIKYAFTQCKMIDCEEETYLIIIYKKKMCEEDKLMNGYREKVLRNWKFSTSISVTIWHEYVEILKEYLKDKFSSASVDIFLCLLQWLKQCDCVLQFTCHMPAIYDCLGNLSITLWRNNFIWFVFCYIYIRV